MTWKIVISRKIDLTCQNCGKNNFELIEESIKSRPMSYDGGLNYGHINQAMAVCMTPDCKFLQSPTLLTANQNMVTVVLDPDDFIWKSPSKAVLFKHWEEQRKEQETKRWKLLDKATE